MRYQVILIALVFFFAAPVSAQFRCTSDISYTWQKVDDEQELKVNYGRVEQQGEAEDQVKFKLEKAIETQKEQARLACSRAHENLSGCLASRLAVMSKAMRNAGFASRRSMEDAALSDCKIQSGSCLKVESSAVNCVDLAPKEEETESEEKEKKKK